MKEIKKFFKDKKILITGHTGFKGGWLTQMLLNWGAIISGIALRPNTKPNLFEALKLKEKIKNYFWDIRDFKNISKIIKREKPEIIFHLAAQPLVRESYNNPLYTFETNIIGTANVLESIRDLKSVKAVIIVTTDKVYENKNIDHSFKESDKLGGTDPYSSSKAASEIIVNSYIKSFFQTLNYGKTHFTLIASARSGNVLGGGDWQKDRLIPDIIRAIFEKKEKIIIRNPSAIRPWQYVLEPLFGYLLLAKNLYEGRTDFAGPWNFGPLKNNYVSVEELVKLALKILKRGSYEIKPDFSKHEDQILKLNSNKARKILKWKTKLSIEEILRLTLEWYQHYYEKKDIIEFTNQQIDYFFKI